MIPMENVTYLFGSKPIKLTLLRDASQTLNQRPSRRVEKGRPAKAETGMY